MEVLIPNEEQNKKWLSVVKEWVERKKHDPSCTLLPSEKCTSLMEDFKNNEACIAEYLMSLDQWLIKYGIKEVLKELPSVGMLLSQLCKLELAVISESVSRALISCIIHLSDILHKVRNDDTASKRAKKWAVDHFSHMMNVDVDGVDMFLMEEFGLSPEEYLKEHIHQSTLQLQMVMQHPDFFEKEDECLHSLFEFCKMADKELLAPMFEATICLISSHHLFDKRVECSLDDKLKWISENKKIMKQLSVETLHVLFKASLPSFENYIISLAEQIIESYPDINQEGIRNALKEARIVELCSLDVRYYLASIQIIKDSFLIIGIHLGLIEFFRSFMVLCSQLNSVANIVMHEVGNFKKYDSMRPHETWVNSPHGLSLKLREEYLRKLEEALAQHYSLETENDKWRDFEVWWCNLQYADWVDESILLLLDGSRQNVPIYLQLFIRFFYPMEYSSVESYLQPLTSYVYALRNLLQKNHIQLTDLEFLRSSLERKLPTKDFNCIMAIMVILGVLFIAKSSGVGAVADKYLQNLLGCGDQHTIYRFLYIIQLLLKTALSRSLINNPLFKDIITNRLKTLQHNHQNNDDIIDLTYGEEDDQASNKVIVRDVSVTCSKIMNDLTEL